MKSIRRNRKGFTLVEIIVVLVILAILAAITIPSMLGFVQDAQGKVLVTEARTAYIAAQTIATEKKAGNAKISDSDISDVIREDNTGKLLTDMINILGPDVNAAAVYVQPIFATGSDADKGKIVGIYYYDSSRGRVVHINAGNTSEVYDYAGTNLPNNYKPTT